MFVVPNGITWGINKLGCGGYEGILRAILIPVFREPIRGTPSLCGLKSSKWHPFLREQRISHKCHAHEVIPAPVFFPVSFLVEASPNLFKKLHSLLLNAHKLKVVTDILFSQNFPFY